jgi:hypothetical protein
MRLLKWTPQRKGALRGFADVELANGLRIYGCPVLVASNGRAWATFPGRPQIDREDRLIRQDGRAQYTKVLDWATRDVADRFSQSIVELVIAYDSNALTVEQAEPAPAIS